MASQEGVTQLEQSALSEAGDSPASGRRRERTASAHALSTAIQPAVAQAEDVQFFQERGLRSRW